MGITTLYLLRLCFLLCIFGNLGILLLPGVTRAPAFRAKNTLEVFAVLLGEALAHLLMGEVRGKAAREDTGKHFRD